MPTASDFRSAASTLQSCADDARAAVGRIDTVYGDTGIEGGRYEDVIDRALDACRLNAASVETQCTDAADECIRRAAICDEYSAALRSHERAVEQWRSRRATHLAAIDTNPHAAGPGRFPSEPSKPFAWVEAS